MAIEPPYGTAIQDAIASGELRTMKRVARDAEKYLRQYGDVSASLEALKLEIARCQRKK